LQVSKDSRAARAIGMVHNGALLDTGAACVI
jgi:hypothetical protein